MIPSALRRSLGFEAGDALVAREEGGRLVLEKPETIKRRLKARFSRVPKDRSLADELLPSRSYEYR
ncbi:MAG: AbrB/MazE/SpoVT family DNA-binding domain-containing protein [Rhizonema sp. PD38]|nr:AbrB/MazE/SpoVT family DNA-binding domain-containing protein [Rhizonema sp. PD38]